VAALLCLCVCGGEQEPPIEPPAALSAERKEQIRRFWTAYRQATDLRVRGAWQEAIPAYQEALALDPRHEDSLYYLGNAFFETGRYEEAIAAWEHLAAVNPHSSRAHLQLGAIHSCGAEGAPFDLERAQGEIRKALEINKEESGPLLKLGEVLLLKGDLEQAQKYLSAAGRANAMAARYLLGYLHWKRGEPDKALELLQQAAELSRTAPRPASASSEGDTKGGKGPLLAAGAARQSFFAPYLEGLVEKSFTTPPQAEEEYRRLDEKLRENVRSLTGSTTG
jgi:tetratricopeptide (TPR) repeat protein